jgi:hypothetical protein
MSLTIGKLNKFVEEFFANSSSYADWSAQKNQSSLKKLFSKNEKASKDSKDKPKRGKTAYIYFCDKNRSVVKDSNPTFGATQITSELGRLWNEFKDSNPDGVKVFESMAETDKLRYQNEKSEKPKTSSKGKSEKVVDPAKKRSKSSYFCFCDVERSVIKAQNPNMSNKEITSELGRRWTELKNDSTRSVELQKYIDIASEGKKPVA